MAQAADENTDRDRRYQPHFALPEEQKYRLDRLGNVVRGLSALTHDNTLSNARDAIEIAREDLAAIFTLIGEQVELALAEVDAVKRH